MNKELQLKPCTPQDVDQAIPLIYESGPEAFDYVFKTNKISSQDFLRFAFVKENGEFSYRNHYALHRDGKIVGVIATFDAKAAKNFILTEAKNMFTFYGLKALPVMIKGLRTEKILKMPKKNEVALVHLGISEERRGQGLGTICMHDIQKIANKKKEQKFVFDVSKENPRAQKLYERLGFKVVKYNPSKLKNKYSYVPSHYRMESE